MANFVLVHGAWIGGWCWRPNAQALRKAGHEVFTPTLTGLGERSHLMNPSINLEPTSPTSSMSSNTRNCRTSCWSATPMAAWW